MQAKRCSFRLIYRAVESRYSIAHFYVQERVSIIKTFTLRKKWFNEFLPVTDREYVTGEVIGDYVRVYSKYNQWRLYCLTSRPTYIPPSVGESWSVQMMNKSSHLLLDNFDITDVVFLKNKKEFYRYRLKHYSVGGEN